jgi:diketogulonate reductase-like aldo/keto reductase
MIGETMWEITLNNGVRVPAISLGTALNKDRRLVAGTICDAVEVGYRAIDTAEAYGNQAGIGEGIRRCGLPREALYISSKIWNSHHGYKEALRAFDRILKELKLDYLDQLLIHWPGQTESFLPTWKAFEKLYRDGLVRVIGVSNFLDHHLETLLWHAGIPPMVDQLELNPAFVPVETVAYCKQHGIQVEATRPICWGRLDQYPPVVTAAKKYGKSPSQVAIRWHIQNGIRPLPKSTHRDRMLENISVFDFELTADEMHSIDGLNTGIRETGQDPDTFWMIGTDFEEENKKIMGKLKQ